jgi:hypothetical protein
MHAESYRQAEEAGGMIGRWIDALVPQGVNVKLLATVVAAACLLSGCVAGSAVSHADDPAAAQRDEGPDLCRDGTAPPCTPRS